MRIEWIAVKDELPYYGDTVVLWDAMMHEAEIRLINFDPQHMDGDYTHWFRLPRPPQRQRAKPLNSAEQK
jgi:hypothetical protein